MAGLDGVGGRDGGQEATSIVFSLLSQPQTPEPSILESAGLEESGIRAVVGAVRGTGESNPLLPLAPVLG